MFKTGVDHKDLTHILCYSKPNTTQCLRPALSHKVEPTYAKRRQARECCMQEMKAG
jgi:hypothetical protein